jgi:hypothetical protein
MSSCHVLTGKYAYRVLQGKKERGKKNSNRGAFRTGAVPAQSSPSFIALLRSFPATPGPVKQTQGDTRQQPTSTPHHTITGSPQHGSQSPGVIFDPRQAATLLSVRPGTLPVAPLPAPGSMRGRRFR